MSTSNHNPKYRYDCENCKFNWNCGPTCHCNLRILTFKNPPLTRRIEVNKALRKKGFKRQFIIPTKNRYVENLAMTCDECGKKSESKILWKDKHGNYWCHDCWPY